MSHTDLVMRLRAEGSELCVEAADIIEHLRENLAFARYALTTIKGTLEDGRPAEPFSVTQDVPPTTPR